MNTTSTCCGSATTSCESTIAELPRYYPRQLITPDDLTLEQNYFRDRMRRHNRLLHGWGVVCGALVCPVTTKDANGVLSLSPWQVQVQKGYVLGPYGDEIILDCIRTVDLRTNGVSGVTGDPCIDVPDPWCSQVSIPRATGPLYIAVKYKQSMTRPVRVQPIGCGCDDNSCECSRWHDGYDIQVLTCCPDAGPPSLTGDQTLENLFTGDVPVCPPCPQQPWVVLAAVQVDSDGTIGSIDNCACRRLVGSLSGFWWQCSQGDTTLVAPTSADPAEVPAGKATTVTLNGSNLDQNATYSFGNGIMVSPVVGSATSTSIQLTVTPDSRVSGLRTLVIVNNQDCGTVTFASVINVFAPTQAVSGPTPKNTVVAKPSPAKTASGKAARKPAAPQERP
jgi:hypothetical protein